MQRTTAIAVVALVACGTWAFWPLPDASITTPDEVAAATQETESPNARVLAIDAAHFTAAIWNPAPPPAEPETKVAEQPPPPPRLNLELVGIITEDDTRKAVLYDPATDELHIIASGESLGRYNITVEAELVRIADGNRIHNLPLYSDDTATPPATNDDRSRRRRRSS